MSIKFLDPYEMATPDNVKDIYDKLRPFNYSGKPIEKVEFDKIGTYAYMWYSYKTICRDVLDEEFNSHFEKFNEVGVTYGYSNHSCYPTIFRRMLLDVIKLGVKEGIFEKFADSEAIYVRTIPCNLYGEYANSVYECYDDDKGHMTKTIYMIRKKEEPVKEEPVKKELDDEDIVPKKRVRRSLRLAMKNVK